MSYELPYDDTSDSVSGLPPGLPRAPRRDVILGRRGPGDLWRWLGTLPDANGAAHGVEAGSLQVQKERARGAMKPTAAALKAQQQQEQQQQQQQQRRPQNQLARAGGSGGGAAPAAAGRR
jgi:hypothetical protein